MYTYTEPEVDIGIGLEPDPFDIEELTNHYRNQTRTEEVEHRMERIPLMERTIPTTEVIPLAEFENNINKLFKLCNLYGKASCELSRQSAVSEEETTRAYDILQPYIRDILEQIEKGLSLF